MTASAREDSTVPYAHRLLVLRSCSGLTRNHACCLCVSSGDPSSRTYQSRCSSLAIPRSSKRAQYIVSVPLGFWFLGCRLRFAIDCFEPPCPDPTEVGVHDDGYPAYRHRPSEQNIRLQDCDYHRRFMRESWEPKNPKINAFRFTLSWR
jgi:hypothetical protein